MNPDSDNHLGSSTFLTDAAGEPYQFVMYLPFGETFAEQRAAGFGTPYLFNAKELDEETGLYYYGARYYDARISTWWGVDPLAIKYPEWTPYAYSLQSPVKYTDPDGKEIVIPFILGVYSSRDAHEYFANQVVQALNKYSNDEYRFNMVSKEIEIASKGTMNIDKDFSANTERIAILIAPNNLGTKTIIEQGKEGQSTTPKFIGAASNPAIGSDATISWNPERMSRIALQNGTTETGDPQRSVHHELIHAFYSNFGLRLEGVSNIPIPEKVHPTLPIKNLPYEEIRARQIENEEIRAPAKQELRKIE